MSSATSIDRDVAVDARPAEQAPAAAPRDSFQPWHFFVLLSLLAATAAMIVARQSRPEILIVLSLTVGAAGCAAAALYRTLAPLLAAEPPAAGRPLTLGTRAALEREKVLVLRAIKELEFDRAMGKVSSKDFEEMAGRLRARAMSLMRQLDAGGGYRELIERELSARLSRSAPRGGAAPRLPQQPAAAISTAPCACGTVNDADAAFCKRCGSRIETGRPS
jgi:hypothetical protein